MIQSLINMNKKPLVSVIIPVYNGEAYLAQTIKTVINQTYSAIEIIIVDDGSTDKSKEIASSYSQVRYIYQENQGVAAARNTGIFQSNGEYIALLDQDDLWTSNKLELQVKYLTSHPDISYVLGQQKIFLESGTEKPKWLKEEHLENQIPAYFLSALLARKSVFNEVGNFSSDYKYSNDSDWFSRTIDLGLSFYILPELVLLKRIHGNNESYQTLGINLELLKLLRASIQRKRQKQTEV